MLTRFKDIHGPLEANGPLHHGRQRSPQGRRHRDENARALEPFAVLRPDGAVRPILFKLLLRARSLLQRQTRHEQQQQRQEERPDHTGVLRRVGTAPPRNIPVRRRRDGHGEDAELHQDLAKVIRMSAPREQPNVTRAALTGGVRAEAVFLHVGHGFDEEPDGPHDQADDVGRGAKGRLRVTARDVGRIQDRHGQADGPDPQHLEDPEAEEREELVALVVEPRVGARLENAEEQEPRQPERPEDQEQRSEDLTRRVRRGQSEREHGKDDKVGAAREIRQFVEFTCKRDREPDQLVGHGHQQRDGQEVVVEDVVDRHVSQ